MTGPCQPPKNPPMTMGVTFWAGMLLALLAAAGCVYEIAAIAMLRRFFARDAAHGGDSQGVTLLKPLHGAEPRLGDNLASFLAQDYPGPVQMVCGVGGEQDTAICAVEQLKRGNPGREIELVTGPGPAFANRKIANLANMLPAARHSLLVLSDSDMAVSQGYLAAIAGALAQPGVGAVTCAYRGRADGGFWSQVSAAAISYHLLPGVVTGYEGGMAQPCMGSTIAMTRKKLEEIGGFARFAGVLADDYAIGEAVAATGARVEIPPLLLIHGCAEESVAALWRQKLRWAATIRGVAPWRLGRHLSPAAGAVRGDPRAKNRPAARCPGICDSVGARRRGRPACKRAFGAPLGAPARRMYGISGLSRQFRHTED